MKALLGLILRWTLGSYLGVRSCSVRQYVGFAGLFHRLAYQVRELGARASFVHSF